MTNRLIVAGLLVLGACQPTPSPAIANPARVTAIDAWCRPTPNGAMAGACYVTFQTDADDRLLGGSTPAAAALQLHEMSTQDGVMKMGEIEGGLPLPAGQVTHLAPGGAHLMLTGLAAPLTEGASISLTLHFADAPDVTVQALVRQPVTGESVTAH